VRSRLVCAALAVVLLGFGRWAGASVEDERAEFDAQIARELEARSPEAAALFAQANQAREKEDHQRAGDLYARVYQLVPGFVHALRRQAMEELALENRDRSIELARKAVAQEASVENLTALSAALSFSKDQQIPQAERREALSLAQRAVELAPNDFSAQGSLAQAALVNESVTLLGPTADRMIALAPEDMNGYYFRGVAELYQGNPEAAEKFFGLARQHGLDEESYQTLLGTVRDLRDFRPWPSRFLVPALWGLAAWAVCLLVLFASGWTLSRATLRAAQKLPAQANGAATGRDLFLRRLYKGVLWLSCLYYWLSIPIVILLVLAAGGGAIYGLMALGILPVKLLAVIALVVLVSLASIVKSLFARSRNEDPGLRLEPTEEPRLRDLLHEVAGKIGTRPVDNVYLTPGTELAVMERGGMLKQLRGTSERCLILGIGVLEGMKLGPFKAILAHEYGHFSNQDTAGGGFALSVRRSVFTMARHLAEGGAAAWYNPAWLFVNGFHRVFLRISQGASRLQEVLADRWAAFTYGAKSFERGLLHVIERDIRFSAHASATLGEVVEGRRALANLYTYSPAATPNPEELQAQLDQALHQEPSPYDSHPSPMNRFLWTRAIPEPGQPSLADEEEVWTLFRDREALEKRLTQAVRENLQSQGIELPEPAAAAT
jgi:Zn-dependent protease with chaperone function